MAIVANISVNGKDVEGAYVAITDIRLRDRHSPMHRQHPEEASASKYVVEVMAEAWSDRESRDKGKPPVRLPIIRGAVDPALPPFQEAYRVLTTHLGEAVRTQIA